MIVCVRRYHITLYKGESGDTYDIQEEGGWMYRFITCSRRSNLWYIMHGPSLLIEVVTYPRTGNLHDKQCIERRGTSKGNLDDGT